tara:strand:- start:1472 stop:3025 length:1554 start_codon:yes stop_codon:yes gene_type:complete
MPARKIGNPLWQFFDNSGAVLASGTINFYSPGTTTAKAIYRNAAKSSSHSNPVTLDSAGRPPTNEIYTEGFYDVVVKDSSGSTIRTISDFGDSWSSVATDLNQNLISNHSFETAGSGTEPCANWTETDSGTKITRDTSDHQHGAASLKFTSSSSSGDTILSDAFALDPNKEVVLHFDIKANNASAQPKIEINWLNNSQGSISLTTLYASTEGITPTSWTRLTGFNSTPPSTTRYGKIKITGNTSGSAYTVNLDNIEVFQRDAYPIDAPHVPVGLVLSRDSGDTSHDINITAGSCKDATGVENIVLRSEITKRIDATWAIGNDAGGMASGESLAANIVLYVWLIKNTGTGNVDALISTSDSSPTMPSGYDVKRYIGNWKLDASNNLVNGRWNGSQYTILADPVQDFTDTSISSGSGNAETKAIKAPPLALVNYAVKFTDAGGTNFTNVEWSVMPGDASWTEHTGGAQFDGGDVVQINDSGWVSTDSSKQIKFFLTYSGPTPDISFKILGWIDRKRDHI